MVSVPILYGILLYDEGVKLISLNKTLVSYFFTLIPTLKAIVKEKKYIFYKNKHTYYRDAAAESLSLPESLNPDPEKHI